MVLLQIHIHVSSVCMLYITCVSYMRANQRVRSKIKYSFDGINFRNTINIDCIVQAYR